ncbi:TPA: PIN domain-containing protein [Pseudomonas aeruginosa]|uniref:PIN domain-containing protein n=1 Tax=Pseudomonas TaxID=286 RepID=UPI0007335E80|nr:PIN domain-containing protein [Pseudomonas aeruginosa]KTF49793.1 twitching motility protein PilT [Pseudomonas aeruginosa]UHP20495.1 VapC [Pseudomonas aeruginosa]HCF4748365.1 PIN domain-containing protein [Pseudomonas aeruginosa]HCF4768780.1 PIN domain-containing protein [Pseudomonas aeruginosa]HCF6284653.1 PIN domain-containing protein [Pseudomonas aeruginosa]
MSKKTYMLDTNICSFIMRERPDAVLAMLEKAVSSQHRIVVSAITYSEMRFGAANPKASPKVATMVDAFVQRLDAVLPWDTAAVDQTTQIRTTLARLGTPIGNNDAAIAGHALAAGCVLVTNNTREFARVPGLVLEDWTQPTTTKS